MHTAARMPPHSSKQDVGLYEAMSAHMKTYIYTYLYTYIHMQFAINNLIEEGSFRKPGNKMLLGPIQGPTSSGGVFRWWDLRGERFRI